MFAFLNRHFEEVLGGIILAIMVTIAFLNVIVRYCTTFSFAWSEELTTNLFVWIVLLGTSCAFRNEANLCVGVFYAKLPKYLRYFAYGLMLLLTITFFGFLCYLGFLEVCDEIELERVSDSLELPYWIYSGPVPLFSLLIIVRLLQRAYSDLRTKNI